MNDIATPAPVRSVSTDVTDADDALMTRHGITRDRDDRYRVEDLSYTSLADALTQVARRARSGRPGA
ncbi:MAG: hypothetical protein ACXWU2_07785 [Allosphingosinicella sp.]